MTAVLSTARAEMLAHMWLTDAKLYLPSPGARFWECRSTTVDADAQYPAALVEYCWRQRWLVVDGPFEVLRLGYEGVERLMASRPKLLDEKRMQRAGRAHDTGAERYGYMWMFMNRAFVNRARAAGLDVSQTSQLRLKCLLPELAAVACEQVKKMALAYEGKESVVADLWVRPGETLLGWKDRMAACGEAYYAAMERMTMDEVTAVVSTGLGDDARIAGEGSHGTG